MDLEVCNRGHEFTEENTLWHRDNGRDHLRRRCRECKNGPRRNGRPTVYVKSGQSTTEHHEDIEDLLSFGATFAEILDRGPFASWGTMRRSLQRRDRFDLIDRLNEKKVVAA